MTSPKHRAGDWEIPPPSPVRCPLCRPLQGYVKSGGEAGMLQWCTHPPRHRKPGLARTPDTPWPDLSGTRP